MHAFPPPCHATAATPLMSDSHVTPRAVAVAGLETGSFASGLGRREGFCLLAARLFLMPAAASLPFTTRAGLFLNIGRGGWSAWRERAFLYKSLKCRYCLAEYFPSGRIKCLFLHRRHAAAAQPVIFTVCFSSKLCASSATPCHHRPVYSLFLLHYYFHYTMTTPVATGQPCPPAFFLCRHADCYAASLPSLPPPACLAWSATLPHTHIVVFTPPPAFSVFGLKTRVAAKMALPHSHVSRHNAN